MNELQVFSYEGNEIRTIQRAGEPWWVLKDVCSALGLSNPTIVSARLDDDEKDIFKTKSDLVLDVSNRGVTIVNESGLYNVILRSYKPEARHFKRWVTHEVLPAIRKHGAYVTDKAKQQALEAKLLNARARVLAEWMKISQQVNSPEYKQICASYASNALAGEPVLPLPAAQERYYSATEIGKELGISAQKVGSLAIANGLKTDEFGKWFFDKAKNANKEVTTFRYNSKAVERFRELVRE